MISVCELVVFNLIYFLSLIFQGSQILSGLSAEEHKALLHLIKRAILATDLTVYMEYVWNIKNVIEDVDYTLSQSYFNPCFFWLFLIFFFRRRKEFFSLANKSGVSWKSEKQRDLLRWESHKLESEAYYIVVLGKPRECTVL